MITGYTEHRLDKIRGYDNTNPYKVGVNGITQIIDLNGVSLSQSNGTNVNFIDYTIDQINYRTFFNNKNFVKIFTSLPTKPKNELINEKNSNTFTDGLLSSVDSRGNTFLYNNSESLKLPLTNENITNSINNSFVNTEYTTYFSTTLSGFDFDDYVSYKEEVKLGIVFPPKIDSEIFIERQSIPVFEVHTRLSEIDNIIQLEEYKNGYYNIKKIE